MSEKPMQVSFDFPVEALARRLAELLREGGRSEDIPLLVDLNEAARLCGISRTTFNKLRHGDNPPPVTLILGEQNPRCDPDELKTWIKTWSKGRQAEAVWQAERDAEDDAAVLRMLNGQGRKPKARAA